MSPGVFLLMLVITVVTTRAQQDKARAAGCTSKFLLPDRPFMVVWNHPSQVCEAHGINLNLSAWDIVENKNDAFAGDNMIIYYNLGDFPALNRQTGKTTKNGGVPQQGDYVAHLKKIYNDVVKSTKPDFDGIAVIDMESWRPLFYHNFDSLNQYQKVSVDIARARYPNLNTSAATAEAVKEFQAGARLFMEGTLNFTRYLRPKGHWGFYQLPRNWGGTSNDQLSYIWRASRGLFPEIYMNDKLPYATEKPYIQGQVNATIIAWAKYSLPDTLILPYSLCQGSGSNFFSKENLTLAVGLPGEMGAAGVVLWGSSSAFYTHDECQLLQQYVRTTLGPYAKNITTFLSACSTALCSAHGRCVNKDYERLAQEQRRETRQEECLVREELLERKGGGGGGGGGWEEEIAGGARATAPYDDYVCRCLAGWSGDHCEKKA